MSRNYLLADDVKNQIYEKLLQVKAVTGLINEVTSPGFDGENENINASSWLISEQLERILTSLETLPLQGAKMPNHFSLGLLLDEPVFTLTIYNEGTYIRSIAFDYNNILNVIEEFKHLQPRIVYPLEKLYKKYIETGDPESRYEVLNELCKGFKNEKDLYGLQAEVKDNKAPKTAINGASNIQSNTI